MNAPGRIALDTNKLNAALWLFPRDRAMIIDGRETKGFGELIERNALKDYTEEKTFHVHTGPRTNWWLPPGA
jgi:hypothetical protein